MTAMKSACKKPRRQAPEGRQQGCSPVAGGLFLWPDPALQRVPDLDDVDEQGLHRSAQNALAAYRGHRLSGSPPAAATGGESSPTSPPLPIERQRCALQILNSLMQRCHGIRAKHIASAANAFLDHCKGGMVRRRRRPRQRLMGDDLTDGKKDPPASNLNEKA